MPLSRVTRVLYKGCIQSSSRMERALASSGGSGAASRLSELPTLDAVRQLFRTQQSMDELFAAATGLMKLANTISSAMPGLDEPDDTTSAAAAAPQYFIGTPFRHRLHGWSGVIVGYDAAGCCSLSEDQVRQSRADNLPHGRAQPFYFALPHCESNSSARSALDPEPAAAAVRYVAQDNIEVLRAPVAVSIVHPRLAEYFSAYLPNVCRYQPAPGLQAAYPLDAAFYMMLQRQGVGALRAPEAATGALAQETGVRPFASRVHARRHHHNSEDDGPTRALVR